MKKKLITLPLSLCMLFGLMSYMICCGDNDSDNKTFTEQGITYTLSEDKQSYVVSACDKQKTDTANILSVYNEKPITTIADGAFKLCDGLKNIIIPDSVTSIGLLSFAGCDALTDVTIGNGVTTIGERAFQMCKTLQNLTIGNNVTEIGSYAFGWCNELENVYISSMENWCQINFAYESSNPLSNGANLYLNDELITNLTIPNSISSISPYAFFHCKSLKSVSIPDNVISIGERSFKTCDQLTNVTIGNGVTVIGESAFSYCAQLTSVTIGNSVTTIENLSFAGCFSLTKIYYTGTEKKWEDIHNNIDTLPTYYYSENPPTESGNYWRYVNGIPTVW